MKYSGKKAVVTGGTRGMGLAVVRALLDGGAEVLATGRDVSGLNLPAHLLLSDALTYAAELAPRGIRVNVVSPGYTDTPTMGVTGVPPSTLAAFRKTGDEVTPLKRHARPEEVAAAVLFLAFEATFTTGADLPVDGGLGQRLTLPA